MFRFTVPPRPSCAAHLDGRGLLSWMLLFAALAGTAAAAEEPARHRFDVAAGPAVVTLKRAAQQAGFELVYSAAVVDGVQTQPVAGEFTPSEALERMVANTPLRVFPDPRTGALSVLRTPDPEPHSPTPPSPPTELPRTMKRKNLITAFTGWLALALAPAPVTKAADGSPAGVVEGRVLNSRNGDYLEKARLTVEGTSIETFTDSSGQFRLLTVPAGTARIKVFFTGLEPLAATVVVAAGQTIQRDFDLGAPRSGVERDGVVKLDEFVVGASRVMDGAAIAINEQRFAPNMKNVVSTDEFGDVAEGNVAEFLKFMPGITIDYSGGNARDISINGVSANYVPVTMAGFSLATASGTGTDRAVSVDMVSINNLSRIEVSFSPTPESQGGALAGSVNMVPRSAFERSRPVFNGSVYLLMRDNARDFHAVSGPRTKRAPNVHPGFDFSYVAPVNKRFGFTFSGGTSTQYSAQDILANTWRGVGTATNGAAFPHTTVDRPYLTSFSVQDNPKLTTRNSVGVTLDFKLTPYDRVSLAVQYSSFDTLFNLNSFAFNVGRVLPGDFTATATRGAAGAGNVQITRGGRIRFNRTYMPTLVWRHDGRVWKAEGGAGMSQQMDFNRSTDKGFFRTATLQRTGVTVSFDDIFYLRPRTITVTDGVTGAPVDPFNLDNYALTSAGDNISTAYDQQRSAYANIRRDFYGRVPLTIKTGLDLRSNVRDVRGNVGTYSFVGRDGASSTTPAAGDDRATPFLDELFSQRIAPYGFPRVQTVSLYELHDFFRANPTQFVLNANNQYRSEVSDSKHTEEIVSSAYVRGDLAFFEGRLKLVGGIRAEQTNIAAQGPLTDSTRNFRRDGTGKIMLDAAGRPLTIVPASNALGVSRLTYIDRGSRTRKEYLRLFPNLNASFNLRENLIMRAAHYSSVGRPNFDQYAGGITLPDAESPPAQNNRIVVNNAGIKAWSAETTNVRIEYYFAGVGQFSVGAFRRDFKNFFGGTVFNATPEFLALYGLDPAIYDPYDVSTQENLPGRARVSGVNLNYKQALTFLPSWARGVQVFANASAQRAEGEASDNFSGYIPRSGSWGASLTRQTYNVRFNCNYRGRQRQGEVAAGPSIEPGTFNWGSKRLYIDVLGEYYFRKKYAVFVNLRNVGDATEDSEISGPNTPAQAQFRGRNDYGSLWMIGVKGTF